MPVFAPATDVSEIELPDPGRYVATCVAIEDAPDKGFGAGVKWIFQLSDPNTGLKMQSKAKGGDYELWQFTSTKMGPKSKARPIIEALLGRPLDVTRREVPDPRQLMGRSMDTIIIYEKRDDGSDKAVVSTCRPFAGATNGSSPSPSVGAPPAGPAGGGLLEQVKGAVRKAEILQTARHLDWLGLNYDQLSDGDLYLFLEQINADIAAS